MAYMHRETFEITQNYDQDNAGDYCEIDDLIAPVIQVLNRKGYITEQCCSGHPFRIFGGVTPPRGWLSCNSYISFKEGISLPSLPPGYSLREKIVTITLPPSSAHAGECFGVLDSDIKNYVVGSTIIYDVTLTEDMIKPMPYQTVLDINRRFDDTDAYTILRDVLETTEQLYKWALELPRRGKNGVHAQGNV